MSQPTGYQIANAVRLNKIGEVYATSEAKKYGVVAEFEAEMKIVRAEQKELGRIAKEEMDNSDYGKRCAQEDKVYRALNM